MKEKPARRLQETWVFSGAFADFSKTFFFDLTRARGRVVSASPSE
jgi:hypothetical protein